MSNAGLCFIFNVYLQCLDVYNNENKLIECFSFIENTLYNELDDSGCDCTVLITGDFNATYEAINNDAILLALNDLLNDLHLACCDDLDKTGVGCTNKHCGQSRVILITFTLVSKVSC